MSAGLLSMMEALRRRSNPHTATWRREAIVRRGVPSAARFAERPQYISYALLLVTLIVLLAYSLTSAERITIDTVGMPVLLILKESAPIILLALAVGLIIAAGKIDISTASLAGLVAVIYACSHQMSFFGGWIVFLFLPAVSALHAAISGYTIAYRKGPSLIVTWALGIVYTSIAGIITFTVTSERLGGNAISGESTYISLISGDGKIVSPTDWQSFSGVVSIYAWILFCLSVIWVSQIDRICRAIGAARRTSRYIGIDERRSVTFAFFLVGIFSSIAGVLHASFARSASVGDMAGKELTAVAVAVLGGTVLSGGYFSARGIVAAGLVYQTLVYLTRLVNAPLFGSLETRMIEVIFALLLLIIAGLFGKLMSGDTEVLVIKSRE